MEDKKKKKHSFGFFIAMFIVGSLFGFLVGASYMTLGDADQIIYHHEFKDVELEANLLILRSGRHIFICDMSLAEHELQPVFTSFESYLEDIEYKYRKDRLEIELKKTAGLYPR
mgnify:FL=1